MFDFAFLSITSGVLNQSELWKSCESGRKNAKLASDHHWQISNSHGTNQIPKAILCVRFHINDV